MLDDVDKTRLIEHVPRQIPVEWTNPATKRTHSTTVSFDVRWQDQDREQYPCLVLERSPAGKPQNPEAQPLDEWRRTEQVPSDDTIARRVHDKVPLFDELLITAAVQSSHDGIPASEVAEAAAKETYERFKFEDSSLERRAVDENGAPIEESTSLQVNETPVGIQNTSGMKDEMFIQRRVQKWRVEYEYEYIEDVTAVDELEWSLDVDADGDGDTDSTYSGRIDLDVSDADGDQDSV